MAYGEVKNMKYAAATYGSLAYDMGAVAVPVPETPVAIPRPERQTQERVRVRERAGTAAAEKYAFSPGACIGYLVAAALLIMVVLSYVQMAVVSAESAALEERISALELEETRLSIKYESAFDLDRIQEYAVNELGMVKPSSSQIRYITSTAGDKAELLDTSVSVGGVLDRVKVFMSRMVEYFR